MALPFTVREFNSSDDFYICTPEALEFTTIDDTTEKEQKPIVKNWELLMRDTHVYLPFYNRTRWELIQGKENFLSSYALSILVEKKQFYNGKQGYNFEQIMNKKLQPSTIQNSEKWVFSAWKK